MLAPLPVPLTMRTRAGGGFVIVLGDSLVSGPETRELVDYLSVLTLVASTIVLDFTAVKRVDAAGIGVLAAGHLHATQAGIDLRLGCVPVWLHRLIAACRLSDVFVPDTPGLPAHPALETPLTGSDAQVEWALRIRGTVEREFMRVSSALADTSARNSSLGRAYTSVIQAILEEKRSETLQAGRSEYFIREWQELDGKVNRLITGDTRYQILRIHRRRCLASPSSGPLPTYPAVPPSG